MSTYETIRLFNTILNLYYNEELTQSKIAKRLGLSTAKVNRLLQQARAPAPIPGGDHPDRQGDDRE